MKPPRVVQDLWRDLRDKRLLPIVGLLLVALIAVPVALGGGEGAAPADNAATAPSSGSEAPEADPVVLVDVPAIREYNERLSEFKRQNPFRQQYTDLPKSAQRALEEQDDTGGGGAAPVDSSTDSGSTAESSDSSGGGSSGGSGGSGGGSGGGSANEDEIILFTWEVDVKVGPVGNAKKQKGVKQGEFVPSAERPVVMFLQGNENTGQALFLVSRDITGNDGDGRCIPDPKVCEFLVLKEGEEHRFDYEPDGQTYRLKLAKVKLKSEVIDPNELSGKELRQRRSAYDDLMKSR